PLTTALMTGLSGRGDRVSGTGNQEPVSFGGEMNLFLATDPRGSTRIRKGKRVGTGEIEAVDGLAGAASAASFRRCRGRIEEFAAEAAPTRTPGVALSTRTSGVALPQSCGDCLSHEAAGLSLRVRAHARHRSRVP